MSTERRYTVAATACTVSRATLWACDKANIDNKPYGEGITNPSEAVVNRLPGSLCRDGRPTIHIIKYPYHFRNVITDMEMIPPLWDGQLKVYWPKTPNLDDVNVRIDAMIHTGMADERGYWSIESMARRDGYQWTGDDGLRLPESNGGEGGRWEGCPSELRSIFDMNQLLADIQAYVPDIPVTISNDAGLLYCELILFTSLATLYKKQEDARVVFFHVPGSETEEDIEKGAEVLKALICAMVDQRGGSRL